MISADPRGSIWRRWDLHIHTPSSVGDYKGAVTNEEIAEKLAASDVSAVSITDHHFIDVARIAEIRQQADGRFVVFPGIEFRTPVGKSPFHFTAVFPEDASLQELWEELSVKLNLTPKKVAARGGHQSLYTELREAAPVIEQLGGIICIHAGSKSNSIEEIPNTHRFMQRFKQDLARDCVAIFEVRSEADAAAYRQKVFPVIGREFPIITASDNHDISSYSNSDSCWIKADCTFAGLRQALTEPIGRICLEEEPEQLLRAREEPTRFIDLVRLEPKSGASEEPGQWFDCTVLLNPGLIAVIGRKGSGKSALLDAIGLAGNAHCESAFSFLSPQRFRDPKKTLARGYQSAIVEVSGHGFRRGLDESVSQHDPEQVRYLPQQFLNAICADPREEAGRAFESELKDVIFQHMAETDRLGQASLDDLLQLQCGGTLARITQTRRNLRSICEEIQGLEDIGAASHRQELLGLWKQRRREIEAHRRVRPKRIDKPKPSEMKSDEPDDLEHRLSVARVQQCRIVNAIEKLEGRKESLQRRHASLLSVRQKIDNLRAHVTVSLSEIERELTRLGFNASDVIALEVNQEPLDEMVSLIKNEIARIDTALSEKNDRSLPNQGKRVDSQVADLTKRLQEPQRKYEAYIRANRAWEKRARELIGDEKKTGTLMWLREQMREAKEAPSRLTGKWDELKRLATEIHSLLVRNADIYRELYAPVTAFISEFGEEHVDEPLPLTFGVHLADRGFSGTFLDRFINHARKGSFYGIEEGRQLLRQLIDNTDLDDPSSAMSFVTDVIHHLQNDARTGMANELQSQLLKGVERQDLYEYLFAFEYLEPTYSLRWDQKTLDQLSPGEKGALLVVFYLLIDRESSPLLIDQPADNLDNETVYRRLVPYVKQAKQRRQIILVTHNPNLAVVCDAEQIIRASYDAKRTPRIKYETGSLENPELRKYAVDVLEGTQPAFDKRGEKYSASRQHNPHD